MSSRAHRILCLGSYLCLITAYELSSYEYFRSGDTFLFLGHTSTSVTVLRESLTATPLGIHVWTQVHTFAFVLVLVLVLVGSTLSHEAPCSNLCNARYQCAQCTHTRFTVKYGFYDHQAFLALSPRISYMSRK